jgi:hypothetical protein
MRASVAARSSSAATMRKSVTKPSSGLVTKISRRYNAKYLRYIEDSSARASGSSLFAALVMNRIASERQASRIDNGNKSRSARLKARSSQ